jgi:hypothetical protein
MESANFKNKLTKLDTSKLIDIVKNYRQYGYSDDVRAYALKLLEQHGISEEDLRLTGNLENTTYSYANNIFSSYKRNSFIAFVSYCVTIVIKGLTIYQFVTPTYMTSILLIVSTVTYLILLLMSFLNQNKFYKLTGSDYGSEGILLYLFLGMPLYIFMYFIFRNQMKERMAFIK